MCIVQNDRNWSDKLKRGDEIKAEVTDRWMAFSKYTYLKIHKLIQIKDSVLQKI